MVDQTLTYQADLDESIKLQRHPFVGVAIHKLAKSLGLNLISYRNGTPAEDRLGGDVVAHFADRLQPMLIDLKLAKTPKAKRASLEFERGINQRGIPWSLDGSKGDIVLWVHPHEKHAYFGYRKRLADAINKADDTTLAFLTSGQKFSHWTQSGNQRFQTHIHLYDRKHFIAWLQANKIGGDLI